MNKIIWKDISSTSIKGLLISELPPITKPKMRVQETEIDGVDGSIIEELGFESYDKKITIGLTKDFDIDEVIFYFSGEGNLVLSNEPNKYYKAKIIEQIDYERLLRFRTATVTFRVQPFKYEYQEEEQITATGNIEGTEVKITDAKITRLQIDGRSTQETRSGKNLINNMLVNETKTGITLTINEDKSVNLSGTATEDTTFYLHGSINKLTLQAGTYTLSGVTGGSETTYRLLAYMLDWTPIAEDIGDGKTFELENSTDLLIYIWVKKGTTVNTTIKPMLEEGTEATEYEAYGVSPSPDYPSEIKSVGYENLFDSENWYETLNAISQVSMRKEIVNGVEYYRFKPDAIYDYQYMKGQFKENTQYTISAKARNYDHDDRKSSGFTFIYTDGTSSGTYIDMTLEEYDYIVTSEVGKTIDYIRLGYAYSDYVLMRDITMVEGTETKIYVPYGKYGVEVETVGKNLFNIDTTNKNKIVDANTGVLGSANGVDTSDYIKVVGGSSYVISSITNEDTYYYNFYIVAYDKNKNYVSRQTISGLGNKAVSLTPQQDGYIRFSYNANATNVMFNKGENVVTYEPYKSNISVIVLNEPLRSLPNGVKDTYENGIVTRRIGKIVLNGSENNWNGYTTLGTNARAYIVYAGAKHLSKALSNYFEYTTYDGDTTGVHINPYGTSVIAIKIPLTQLETEDLQGIKTWLSTHNTEVLYELETPTTEELGDITMLELVDGENNISNNAETNMIIDYIDNKLIINNLGNYVSKPTFEIEGAGQIKFILNGNSVFTYNFDDDGRVIIDSEKEDAYLGSVLKNRNMNGEFPKLEIGENIISWDGLVKNIKVIKKSRWL